MRPYLAYSDYLKDRFGERVHRIALDAGFGCPHRRGGRGAGGCVYCGPAGSGSGAFDRKRSVAEQMQRGIDRLTRSGVRLFIAYFQAFCGTGADPRELRRLYVQALSFPGVVGLAVGTRPDMVPEDVLEMAAGLKKAEPEGRSRDVWLELGLQSANDDTLRRIRRGHDVAAFDDAVKRADRHGLLVAAHVILGLPGEGEGTMMATADHIARLPLRGVKLHHLFVEQETELAHWYARGEFQTLSLEDYVELAIGFLRRLRPDMVIMRLAGQAERGKLVAPRWNLVPAAVAQRIDEEMRRRGVRQGDLYEG